MLFHHFPKHFEKLLLCREHPARTKYGFDDDGRQIFCMFPNDNAQFDAKLPSMWSGLRLDWLKTRLKFYQFLSSKQSITQPSMRDTNVLSPSQCTNALNLHIRKGYIMLPRRFQEHTRTRISSRSLADPSSYYGVKPNGRPFC